MRKQRAFQPTADPLESRNAQSALVIPAHIVHSVVHSTVQFNTPVAHTMRMGFVTTGGISLSMSRTVTRPATTPIRVTTPSTTFSTGTTSMTTTAVPGFISGLTFPGAVPGQISGLTFTGAVPGQISGLTFTGAVPGIISGLSFPTNIPE